MNVFPEGLLRPHKHRWGEHGTSHEHLTQGFKPGHFDYGAKDMTEMNWPSKMCMKEYVRGLIPWPRSSAHHRGDVPK